MVLRNNFLLHFWRVFSQPSLTQDMPWLPSAAASLPKICSQFTFLCLSMQKAVLTLGQAAASFLAPTATSRQNPILGMYRTLHDRYNSISSIQCESNNVYLSAMTNPTWSRIPEAGRNGSRSSAMAIPTAIRSLKNKKTFIN